jgi:putative SOS response-associated peptidase YedK
MCGKFTQMMRWGGLVTLDDLIKTAEGPSETVTPMRFATILRGKPQAGREAVRMRWGLVPPWAKEPNRSPIIHARAETIEVKPAFKHAFLSRRGILVVKTFNEGKEIAANRTEQHSIAPKDGKPIAIAVVFDRWGEKPGAALETFAMVTVPANALIGAITDRMPAVIEGADWGKWLGEEPASISDLKGLLVPFEGNWTMAQEKKPAAPRRPAAAGQASLI